MIQLKRFGELGTAWTQLNDYEKAKWKLTGMYILVFFVLLNLFTISLFAILQKIELDYVKKTNIIWQQKTMVFPDQDVTILEWNTDTTGFNKQDIIELHKNFVEDIKHWIIIIELILLILAGVTSYFLAQKTLKPIKKKNDLQKQFLADVSHELKNPLSSLKINLEVAQKQTNLSSNEIKEILNDLEEEVDRLNQMTEDLLLLENITNQKEKTKFNVKSVIKAQISLLEPLAKNRNITIKQDLQNYTIKINIKEFEQVVYNLIHNAIKFSKPNSIIKIILTSDGLLSIIDSGMGIEDKELINIFKRFYKIDSSRTFANDNGSGLGLSIVKKISDKNDWKINVRSKINKGTIFEIHLK